MPSPALHRHAVSGLRLANPNNEDATEIDAIRRQNIGDLPGAALKIRSFYCLGDTTACGAV